MSILPNGNRYRSLYARLVANTVLAERDNPASCWVWTGATRRHYPCLTVRRGGHLRTISAHRAILEELLQVDFPFDEAGHLCKNTLCINPDHLEIQAPAHNKAERRGYTGGTAARWIPVLFPREDPLQRAADAAWPAPRGRAVTRCPF